MKTWYDAKLVDFKGIWSKPESEKEKIKEKFDKGDGRNKNSKVL